VDKFLDLPLPQRLLVVGILLAVIGGATYHLVISETSDQITNQERKYRGLMSEYAKLKEYDSPEFRQRMEVERAEAVEKQAKYTKMLPPEEELPDLITSMKNDADGAGLVLTRFEPVKEKIEGEGYRGIPFRVEVTGNFPQLVSFFQALAAPSKRVVNSKDIRIEALTGIGELSYTAGDVGLLRILADREKRRGLTPQEAYAKTVLIFEELAKRTMLKARFMAMAYVYTGGAVSGQPGAVPGSWQ